MKLGLSIDKRELIGTRDAQLGAGFQHMFRRNRKIEVVRQRRGNKLRQRWIVEQLDPFLVGQRGTPGGSGRAAKLLREGMAGRW